MSATPPLKILYQDEWMVAVNKPAGWLVHPASEPQKGDLVAMKTLRDQIGKRVNPIHRIDRPTTGVLLMGKDSEASKALHNAFATHKIQKTYWAIIHGRTPNSEWECHEPIQKEPDKPIRHAHTSFRLLETVRHPKLKNLSVSPEVKVDNNLSLIEAIPHTGRFHQIRRHLLHLGYPIIGDYRYGGIARCDHLGELLEIGSRMLLIAKKLEFIHPITKAPIKIEAPTESIFEKCYLG